jgi:hypothetical protein
MNLLPFFLDCCALLSGRTHIRLDFRFEQSIKIKKKKKRPIAMEKIQHTFDATKSIIYDMNMNIGTQFPGGDLSFFALKGEFRIGSELNEEKFY